MRHESGGQFYAPTVLVGVRPAMRIWREEVFGPVMVIVQFKDDDEAVRLANDCPFGLGSAVFSRSQRRANAIGRLLEVREFAEVKQPATRSDLIDRHDCSSLVWQGHSIV